MTYQDGPPWPPQEFDPVTGRLRAAPQQQYPPQGQPYPPQGQPWPPQGQPWPQQGYQPPQGAPGQQPGYGQYAPGPPQAQWPQQPAPAPSPPHRKPAPKARKRQPSARRGFAILGVLVIGIIVAVVELTGGGSGSSFKATVAGYTVINPADLSVAVHVTNTGSSPATPTCTVEASDPSGAYTGLDEGSLTSPVPAGQTDTFVDNVTITHQGAQYVTQVTVSC